MLIGISLVCEQQLTGFEMETSNKMGYIIIAMIVIMLGIYSCSTSVITVMKNTLQAEAEVSIARTPSGGDISKNSSHGQVDWIQIFNFVPNHVEKCRYLFGGNATLPDDFTRKFKIYAAIVRNTSKHAEVEGYTALFRYAIKTYLTLAAAPFVRTICETGFNAGHSTFGWLSVNSRAHVYSFDIGYHSYSRPMAEHLQNMFPGRITVTWGDSRKTLPRFHRDNPDVKCDLVIVDGGHEFDIAHADLYNFMDMSNKNNILILDNYPEKNQINQLGKAWESAKRRGDVLEIFSCDHEHPGQNGFGFSVGRYVLC